MKTVMEIIRRVREYARGEVVSDPAPATRKLQDRFKQLRLFNKRSSCGALLLLARLATEITSVQSATAAQT